MRVSSHRRSMSVMERPTICWAEYLSRRFKTLKKPFPDTYFFVLPADLALPLLRGENGAVPGDKKLLAATQCSHTHVKFLTTFS